MTSAPGDLLKRTSWAAVIMALLLVSCVTPLPTSISTKQVIDVADDPARQGKLLINPHYDYNSYLRGALAKNKGGLHQLFLFTGSEAFVGAGAEGHSLVLKELLHLWGDHDFARALRAESPEIRCAVIGALDYVWGRPNWTQAEFPQTYVLAEHEKIKSED